MKNPIYLAVLSLIIWSCSNLADKDSGVYDVRSVEVLDSLSATLGELTAVSYTLNTVIVERNSDGNLVETTNENDVYMRGPNKMHIHTKGTKGEQGYWYNGSSFSFYSYDRNEYDTVAAPNNIIEAIDFLHNEYNIDFPAADFFYPTLTDDILENFDKLLYWGESPINDTNLHTISAYNKEWTVQIWVNNETLLPAKLVMFNEAENKGERYEATFSNWRLNPTLPDVLFEFAPSESAVKVNLQPKK